MKYRSFRNAVAMLVFLSLGGTCYGCYGWWQHAMAKEEAQRRVDEKAAAERRAQDERTATAAALKAAQEATLAADKATKDALLAQKAPGTFWLRAPGLRPLDREVLALLDRPVVEKIKDASRGRPYKINVYSDDMQRFNRIKIDLDRDEKDDESWTIKSDGSIERKVAENDDGKYNQSWRLDIGSGWVSLDGPPVPAVVAPTPVAPVAPAATGTGVRPVDSALLGLVLVPHKEGVPDKVKDATKGTAYKINLYSDNGQNFNRAKIDLNRNDKWDESWTFGDRLIERKVAPADDENYTEVWVLEGMSSWTRR